MKTKAHALSARGLSPFLFLFALALALPASAQADEPSTSSPSASISVSGTSEATIGDDQGEMGMVTTSVRTGWDWLTLGYSRTDYTWSDVEQIAFGNSDSNPWDTLHSLSLSSRHTGMFDDAWGWFADVGATASWEEEMDDAWGLNGSFGGVYVLNDNISFTLGAGAQSSPVGFDAMPLAGVKLDYVDQTGEGFFASLGIPENKVGYAFSDDVSMTLGLKRDGSFTRLADDSDVVEAGYMEMNETHVYLETKWRLWEAMSVSFTPEYGFDRSLTIYDESGDENEEYALDNAYGAGVMLRYEF